MCFGRYLAAEKHAFWHEAWWEKACVSACVSDAKMGKGLCWLVFWWINVCVSACSLVGVLAQKSTHYGRSFSEKGCAFLWEKHEFCQAYWLEKHAFQYAFCHMSGVEKHAFKVCSLVCIFMQKNMHLSRYYGAEK